MSYEDPFAPEDLVHVVSSGNWYSTTSSTVTITTTSTTNTMDYYVVDWGCDPGKQRRYDDPFA